MVLNPNKKSNSGSSSGNDDNGLLRPQKRLKKDAKKAGGSDLDNNMQVELIDGRAEIFTHDDRGSVGITGNEVEENTYPNGIFAVDAENIGPATHNWKIKEDGEIHGDIWRDADGNYAMSVYGKGGSTMSQEIDAKTARSIVNNVKDAESEFGD